MQSADDSFFLPNEEAPSLASTDESFFHPDEETPSQASTDDSFFLPDEETLSLARPPPAQNIEDKEMESQLAKEINQLSMAERDEVLRDIHGVNDDIEETPELVAQKLVELENALQKIRKKDAYDLAQFKSPEYAREYNFRLMFLRAERFAPSKAAARIVRHFETKLELFGPEKIARDIIMDDLGEDGITSLVSGFTQNLPVRDSSGRAIHCWIPALRHPDCSIKARLRHIFYVAMLAMWDEETQKKGIVILVYLLGESTIKFDPNGAWHIAALGACCPPRISSVHVCVNDSRLYPLIALGLMVAGSYTRLRYRYHRGTPQECFYKLLTFGIPGHALPFNKYGVLLEKTKEKWELVRRQEQNVPKDKKVRVPGSFDILLGRGKPLQDNPGNVRYRHFIERNHGRYTKAATRHLKTAISEDLLDSVKAQGGRFLKLDDNGWTEADNREARGKISHSFRSLRTIISKEMDKSKTSATDTTTQDKRAPAVVSLARPEVEEKEIETHITLAKRARSAEPDGDSLVSFHRGNEYL